MTLAKTAARGYGGRHQQERRRWANALAQGLTVQCACTGQCLRHPGRCTTIIEAHTDWDLMHTPDRTDWLGPGCRPCNRADGAINSNSPATMRILTRPADRW